MPYFTRPLLEKLRARPRLLLTLAAFVALALTVTVVLVSTIIVKDRVAAASHSGAELDQASEGSCRDGSCSTLAPSESQPPPPLPTPSISLTALPSIAFVSVTPSQHSTAASTGSPSYRPSISPTAPPTFISYSPGNLTVQENSLWLSQGLKSRIIARTGQKVAYANGGQSAINFHRQPDYGAAFPDVQENNPGGWIYVSNSEDRNKSKGGVGAITFNADGDIIDYRMILQNTTSNCGGGPTPWGAWISCEETKGGVNWQVDPTGVRPPGVITLGNDGGFFESFAYDLDAEDGPQFFVTEDHVNGSLQRFRPDVVNWSDPWNILYGSGTTDYLVLRPSTNTFLWTKDRNRSQASAMLNYPNTEGVESVNGKLFFVSKVLQQLFTLDLRNGTFTNQSTKGGAFEAQPDQIKHILPDENSLLFFTEDGGNSCGIHARDSAGRFFSILESFGFPGDETTGVSFSPDRRHLYFAVQDVGYLYDVTRADELPFQARTLNIKYHSTSRR